jgi:hypothetical protein
MNLLSHSEIVVLALGLLLLAGYIDVRRRGRALRRESSEVYQGDRWYFWIASQPTPAPLVRLERLDRRYIAERLALAIGLGLWLLVLIALVVRLVVARLSA